MLILKLNWKEKQNKWEKKKLERKDIWRWTNGLKGYQKLYYIYIEREIYRPFNYFSICVYTCAERGKQNKKKMSDEISLVNEEN